MGNQANEKIERRSVLLKSEKVRNCRSVLKGRYLTLKGEYTTLYYIADGQSVSFWRHNITAPIAVYNFDNLGKDSQLVDISYLPFKDGSDGVAIAINYSSEKMLSFVIYYSIARAKIITKLQIPHQITCISTIFDNMSQYKIRDLHPVFHNSPHLIAVGTKNGCCFLVHLGFDLPLVEHDQDAHKVSGQMEAKRLGRIHHLPLEEISVTSVVYIEKCKLIMIGFSFGGFLMANISSEHRSDIYWFSESSVFAFAYQEAADDPRPFIFLWIAHSSCRHNKMVGSPHVILAIVHFPKDEKLEPNDRSYLNPVLHYHLTWFPNESFTAWLSFRTILQKESTISKNSSGIENKSRESSQGLYDNDDTSLLLMSWKSGKKGIVRGVVFDLNAFYYKRLVNEVFYDSTIAHQNAFLSRFVLWKSNDLHEGSPFDIMVSPNSIHRYESPWKDSSDVLHYCSVISFDICTFTETNECYLNIPSIQQELLNFIELNLEVCLGKNRKYIALWISAVGLVNPFRVVSDLSEADFINILSALLYHGLIVSIKNWINYSKEHDLLNLFGKCLWEEIEDAKSRLDELVKPIFDRTSFDFSKNGLSWMRSISRLFFNACSLYTDLLEKSSDRYEIASLAHKRMASRNLYLYSKLLLFFLDYKLIPEKESTISIYKKMQEFAAERSLDLSSSYRVWLRSLLLRIDDESSSCSDDMLTQWLPSHTLLDLASYMLLMKLNDAMKYKLVGYYLLDYGYCSEKSNELYNQFARLFFNENIALKNEIYSEWKMDNGQQVIKKETIQHEQPFIDRKLCVDSKNIKVIRDEILEQEDGKTLWNQYCILNKYFDLLLMPEKIANDSGWRRKCDAWTTCIISNMPKCLRSSFTERSMKDQNNSDEQVARSTSQSLRDYCSEICESPLNDQRDSPLVSTDIQIDDEVDESLVQPFDTVPCGENHSTLFEKLLSKEKLDNVQRLLTPTSASRAGGDSSRALYSPRSPPHSILKSAKKKMNPGYTYKKIDATLNIARRLRFELANREKPISNSDLKLRPNVATFSVEHETTSRSEQISFDHITECCDSIDNILYFMVEFSSILGSFKDLDHSFDVNEGRFKQREKPSEGLILRSYEEQEEPLDDQTQLEEEVYVQKQIKKTQEKYSGNYSTPSIYGDTVVERSLEEQDELDFLTEGDYGHIVGPAGDGFQISNITAAKNVAFISEVSKFSEDIYSPSKANMFEGNLQKTRDSNVSGIQSAIEYQSDPEAEAFEEDKSILKNLQNSQFFSETVEPLRRSQRLRNLSESSKSGTADFLVYRKELFKKDDCSSVNIGKRASSMPRNVSAGSDNTVEITTFRRASSVPSVPCSKRKKLDTSSFIKVEAKLPTDHKRHRACNRKSATTTRKTKGKSTLDVHSPSDETPKTKRVKNQLAANKESARTPRSKKKQLKPENLIESSTAGQRFSKRIRAGRKTVEDIIIKKQPLAD
ncbi:unnamed protein product [Dracunculus medinensis]|uniref:ELYS-bb domain-containing protein n=1 Tax=Dracunculus medinensis TaxID=318479 RepID=A0A0N4U129_DRAME|nr:unnamed protein product [Dracunculus medinensis]